MRRMEQREIPQGIELRRGGPADREKLTAMYRSFEPKAAAFGLPPRGNLDRWLDLLSGCRSFVLVAEGRIVGHAVLCPDGPSAEVAVFVHQDFRYQGLGKRLLAELIKEARRLGLRRLWEITEPTNIGMRRLARSLGFVRSDQPDEFYLDLEKLAEVEEDEVRKRAYEIYLARGSAPGREVQNWLDAERELQFGG
ncbi:MAG TPA: GNAT family N-acetyltransferase [Terriglobales bacterium]|nr:GNAT family N-acetyltransferase [Terriglobales bacterium]